MIYRALPQSLRQLARTLSLVLVVLLAACGSSAPESKSVPTATSVTAEVPGTGAETPTAALPQPTLPPASAGELALIRRAVENTSVLKVDRLHFVQGISSNLWASATTEGDYVHDGNVYLKQTQGTSVSEILTIDNKAYCKDKTGKWIVLYDDLNALNATMRATTEAINSDVMATKGVPVTPEPMAVPSPDPAMLAMQLPMYGTRQLDDFRFGYAGEDIVDGIATKHYVGRFAWASNFQSSTNEDGTATSDSDDYFKNWTLSLWVDPDKEQIRKVEEYNVYPQKPKSDTASDTTYSYTYRSGCGEPTPVVPPTSPIVPTMPALPYGEKITFVTTITYSKINDPSVVLPTP